MQTIDQQEYTQLTRELLLAQFQQDTPKAFVHTFGCQGNVADGERLKGMLAEMGYSFTDDKQEADLILFNTCAIREHAEDRVFGNVGALKNLKAEKRHLKILLCGCMMQQEHVADKIKNSYQFVDIVFGTHVIHCLPELLYRNLSQGKRVFLLPQSEGEIHEELPVLRDSGFRAWLPILYGCNNFCSYCIVPYVRGRERSRESQAILQEARDLVAKGYKEVTLLGQNVNSYGKTLGSGIDFAWLLRELNQIEGDFRIRFMTSHPKDCSPAVLDAMADCEKVAKHLHLPVQSGNNRILQEMNRHYTREQYLSIVEYACKRMPELAITSDIIVGFPGETYEEFQDTLSLLEQVQFQSLFTFLFSPREGTKAAALPDPVPRVEKVAWFQELTALQEQIAQKHSAALLAKAYRVLCEEKGNSQNGMIAGRLESNAIVEFAGEEALIGSFQTVQITRQKNRLLVGRLV